MPRTTSTIARRVRLALTLALLAACALPSGCSKRSTTEPQVGRYSLSGRVRLIGHEVRSDGVVTGTRVVDDADGVHVVLIYGTQTIAQAFTEDGVYRFTGLGPGGYVARAIVLGVVQDETATLTVTGRDVVATDTIELRSLGDIHPSPNPSNGLVILSFGIPDTQYVELRIRSLRGTLVQSLYGQVLDMGRHDAQWTWVDLQNQPATEPYYWATLQTGSDTRAHLLMQ